MDKEMAQADSVAASSDHMQLTSFHDAWALILGKLTDWAQVLIQHIPNAILGLVLLFIGILVAGYAAKASRRLGHRFFDSSAIVDLVSGIIKVLIIIGAVFVMLSVFNLHKTVTSLLAGAGILGLAIGFAFQDLASNFIAGFFMGVRRPFNIGEVIKTSDQMGTVKALNMRSTIIENFDGQIIVIPNKEVFQNPLINYHATGKRKLVIDIGVAYDSDLDQVEQVLRESVADLDFVHPDQQVEVWCRGFGASSVDWQIFVWIPQPTQEGQVGYFAALDIVNRKVFSALKKAGITIPFPTRTVEITGSLQTATRSNENPDADD